jgi:hypothetical protein
MPLLAQLADPGIVIAKVDTGYLTDWRRDFDYVLVFDPAAAGDPAAVLPQWLEPLTGNDVAALYRVRRPATP